MAIGMWEAMRPTSQIKKGSGRIMTALGSPSSTIVQLTATRKEKAATPHPRMVTSEASHRRAIGVDGITTPPLTAGTRTLRIPT